MQAPATLERLMRWYADQCDGEWEHGDGVTIETLDNPGWHVRIETGETSRPLRDIPKPEDAFGEDSESCGEWQVHWVEGGTFLAYGDPSKLETLLGLFFDLVDGGRH